jgi:predicted DNA-binding transcriptional regulator YafY
MFSDEEAVAVLAGLTLARGTANQLSESSAMATAVAKIQRSLPRALAERLEALLDVVIGANRTANEVDPSVLLTAADAVRSRRPVAMTYQSANDETQRTVQPHSLIAYNGRWYLTGLDSKVRENRTFRLDRILSLRGLDGTFPAPAIQDALGDLVRGFASADYRYTVRLRIQASASDIGKHFPPSVAGLKKSLLDLSEDPWTDVTIHAEALDWLPRTLLALDRPVIIEEPAELRLVLLEQSKKLALMAVE